MAAEIKNLDTDLQMLVYENYNKFISATDTIKRWWHFFTVIAHCSPSCSEFEVLVLLRAIVVIFFMYLCFPCRMKTNSVGMETNMEQLLGKACIVILLMYSLGHTWNQSACFFCQITSVQSRSDTVNTSLFNKRENIEKLHRTRNLLRKVQVKPVLFVLFFWKTWGYMTNHLCCYSQQRFVQKK